VVTAPASGGRKIKEEGMVAKTTKTTKTETVLKLLTRNQGATIEQIQKATGWKPHSVRAALTGLRKKDHDIRREKNAKGATVYTIARQ